MADDCKRLARHLHPPDKLTSFWLHPYRIGVECTSRQHNSIKIIGTCLVECHIDVDASGFRSVIHSLYRSRFGRYDLCSCSGLIKCLLWFSQLYHLEVFGRHDGNAHSIQCISLHCESPSSSGNGRIEYSFIKQYLFPRFYTIGNLLTHPLIVVRRMSISLFSGAHTIYVLVWGLETVGNPYPILTARGSCSGFVPRVHHRRETIIISRPNTLMANWVIRPMNARSKPTAVIRGQMLGAGLAEYAASRTSCLEVELISPVALRICSIVACKVRASNGLERQVTFAR